MSPQIKVISRVLIHFLLSSVPLSFWQCLPFGSSCVLRVRSHFSRILFRSYRRKWGPFWVRAWWNAKETPICLNIRALLGNLIDTQTTSAPSKPECFQALFISWRWSVPLLWHNICSLQVIQSLKLSSLTVLSLLLKVQHKVSQGAPPTCPSPIFIIANTLPLGLLGSEFILRMRTARCGGTHL